MIKRLSVIGLSAFAMAGLFSSTASAAGGCASLYVNANGNELVNQTICTP